jgi:protein SCO1/2
MTLRAFSRVIVIALVILVGVAIFAHDQLARGQASVALRGTDLGGQPAPAFALDDQSGRPVSLAGLRGRPVVLAFLDTRSPAGDGLTADKLHTAVQSLGSRAYDVAWVAVSTDPAGDTPAAAASFVAQHQLSGLLRYLVGTDSQLQPVWAAYGVAAGQQQPAGGLQSAAAHTQGVYVIDGQGRERVYLDSAFAASALSGDVRALL